MNSDTRKLLEAVQQGAMSVDEALLVCRATRCTRSTAAR